jgi:hypothetical protein
VKKCQTKKAFALQDAILTLKIADKKKTAPGTVKQARSTAKNSVKANHKQPYRDERPEFLNTGLNRQEEFHNSSLANMLH